YCHKAKEYLGKKNVSFAEIDVSSDEEGRREMITQSGQMGVPVIVIDGGIIIGFNQEKLDKAIN
ncbi:NrdH-redoxin, partial [Candidatus Saccharibacteria bacterium]|nr:NrdH-redoxin [Candidatus Saccharibacteria bacterium]